MRMIKRPRLDKEATRSTCKRYLGTPVGKQFSLKMHCCERFVAECLQRTTKRHSTVKIPRCRPLHCSGVQLGTPCEACRPALQMSSSNVQVGISKKEQKKGCLND